MRVACALINAFFETNEGKNETPELETMFNTLCKCNWTKVG